MAKTAIATEASRSIGRAVNYGSETPPREFEHPPTLVDFVQLHDGQVKLFKFGAKLSEVQQCAEAMPQHRPRQHVVCLHHFDEPMVFVRNLDGRTKRETTAKGDIAFVPADAPTTFRPEGCDQERFLSYSYLVFEPTYLAELALSSGIGRSLDFVPSFSTPDLLLHQIATALTAAPRVQDPAENLYVESLLNAACARVLHAYADVRYPFAGPPRLTDDQLRNAVDYIHQHLSGSLNLRSISGAAGLSEFHFARLFKKATGETPFQFATRTRMGRAKELLRKTRLPISEIAGRVGYQKPSHFSARFSVVCGCGPNTYRHSVAG